MVSMAIAGVIYLVFLISQVICAKETRNIREVTYENEGDVFGNYRFRYETNDGTSREETGKVTNPESDDALLVVHGSYSFISPEGQRYTVHYVADENGFRPEIRKPSDSTQVFGVPSVLRIGNDAVASLQGGGLG